MGAFNGSGVFVRSYSWTNDAANGIDITASRVDTEDTGFASGLSLCVTRDGQGQMAADFLPSAANTYKLGSASFPWTAIFGQTITLTAGGAGPVISAVPFSAGTALTIALSGGPTAVLQTNASDVTFGSTTSHAVKLIANNNLFLQCSTTGAVSMPTATAGSATFTVTGNGGSSIWALGMNSVATTGIKTAGFTATNKPGSNNQTGPSIWLPIVADGQIYWVPGFLP